MVSVASVFSAEAPLSARAFASAALLCLVLASFAPRAVALPLGLYGFASFCAASQLLGDLRPPNTFATTLAVLGWVTYALAWGTLAVRNAGERLSPAPSLRDNLAPFSHVEDASQTSHSAAEAPTLLRDDRDVEQLQSRARPPRAVPIALSVGALGGLFLVLPIHSGDRPRVAVLVQTLVLLGVLGLLRVLAGWASDLHFAPPTSQRERLRRAWLPALVLVLGAPLAWWWGAG